MSLTFKFISNAKYLTKDERNWYNGNNFLVLDV